VLSAFPNNLILVEGGPNFSSLAQNVARRGIPSLSKSIPALSVWGSREGKCPTRRSTEVAVKRKRPLGTAIGRKIVDGGGFYYGITGNTLSKASKPCTEKRMSLSDSMYEALEELKTMRKEMEQMRADMQKLRWKMLMDGDLEEDSEEAKEKRAITKRKLAREADVVSKEVEKWAKQIMLETEEDGWKKVECSKMMRGSLNPDGATTASIKVRTESYLPVSHLIAF
jgi:hypothetical protein